jgi:hypothetical protein
MSEHYHIHENIGKYVQFMMYNEVRAVSTSLNISNYLSHYLYVHYNKKVRVFTNVY